MFLDRTLSHYLRRLSQSMKGTSMTTFSKIKRTQAAHHETGDAYSGVITNLCDSRRVITCRDNHQWITQYRKKGGAERPWRGVGYFRTREALIRACATLCGRIDPNAVAILLALPTHFGGSM